jgi:hypothetical protein
MSGFILISGIYFSIQERSGLLTDSLRSFYFSVIFTTILLQKSGKYPLFQKALERLVFFCSYFKDNDGLVFKNQL